MNDAILLSTVAIGLTLWIWLSVAELVYNRCKRRAVMLENANLLAALSELYRSHQGWQHGIGQCVCAAHSNARAAISLHHKRGGR